MLRQGTGGLVKIATWNINGIKARLDGVVIWLNQARPDIVCLQEIKAQDEAFPGEKLEELGYNVAVHGQKGFNGVAILSKLPFDEIIAGLPGDDGDDQARDLEAVVSTGGGVVRVASIYLPNGNPVDSDKFGYKLAWMDRLNAHARELLALEEPFVLAGDYNAIPSGNDAHDPKAWEDDALYQPETRAKFHALVHLGLTDALRACRDEDDQFTFWDYQGGAWPKNHGIRIDHLLLSPQAADRIRQCAIDRATRGWEKPSDHVPVWLDLDTG